MGYRRESNCRYCYRYGHTKRSCPSLPQSLKDEYARKAKMRMCNYCSEIGHNRSSCGKRKVALAKFKKDELLKRQAVNSFYRANGIGVGAILSYTLNDWTKSYYKIESDVDTLVLKEVHPFNHTNEPRFLFHSSAFNKSFDMSVSTFKGQYGNVSIPFVDSTGNKSEFCFYPDHIVDVLIPTSIDANIYSYELMYDENTVTDIPDNLVDTVRRKKSD